MKRLFENKNKKIIIGSNLQEIDVVIKYYVKKYKQTIVNFEKETIKSLAISLVQDEFIDYELLDQEETKALFYAFLKENIQNNMIFDLIPEESFSLATSNDAYDAINQIRNGKVINNEHKLVKLINKFEEYLLKEKYFDEPLILAKAIELVENKKINDVSFYLLPSLKGKLTYLEISFLEKLSNNNSKYLEFDFPKQEVERTSIQAYGYSNVIKYIVKEIKDNNYNLDDVAIYDLSNAYGGLIKGYFDNYHINYVFQNGESILNEDSTSFIISILDFMKEHFNIAHLYNIYKNPALQSYIQIIDEEMSNEDSYSNTKMLKNLRADKEQIIKQVSSWKDEPKKQFVLDLLALYDDTYSASQIFTAVLSFSKKYINSLYHDELVKKEKLFKFYDSLDLGYEGKIELIKAVISTIKIKKELVNKDDSYVLICTTNNVILPRKYNFFIGLATNEMMVSEIESPLVSDGEYQKIIDCDNYYVKLAKQSNAEKMTNINKLIETQDEGKQYFVTSIYDSVEFKELSKSSFYNGIKKENEKIFSTTSDIKTFDIDVVSDYLYPQVKEYIDKVNNNNLSPSAIETLMKCPLKYIYSCIYDDIELDEYNGDWFKGGDEGNFAHGLLERYFNNVQDRTSIDDALFEECFNEIYLQTKQHNPFSNEHIQDIEANRVKKMVNRYLERYYQGKGNYKPIACELNIKNNDSVIYDNNKDYQIHGIVDRIDGYVDENKHLKIKIVDYKTYSSSSFDNHEKENLLTQVILYPLLVNNYINKHYAEIRRKTGDFEKEEKYDISFVYELLKLNKAYKANEKEIKEAINDSLDKFLMLKVEPTWHKFKEIYQPDISKGGKNNEGKCQYCPYVKYCRLKMQEGDNNVW